ncbi:hypothetical protein CLH61_10390 [Marinobacter profundi]|uniref:Uncharacterized protein n=1 Tax=Marinobacter profundi TaxID=2666256 RepID=A0A2G1UK15_9GAMM|nr:hypothetical protein CLH61_10390 [Marinobacter profundi]
MQVTARIPLVLLCILPLPADVQVGDAGTLFHRPFLGKADQSFCNHAHVRASFFGLDFMCVQLYT